MQDLLCQCEGVKEPFLLVQVISMSIMSNQDLIDEQGCLCVCVCACVLSILVLNYFNNGVCMCMCVYVVVRGAEKLLAGSLESVRLYMKRHISVSCHHTLSRTTNRGGTDTHLAELELSSHSLALCSSCCQFIFIFKLFFTTCVLLSSQSSVCVCFSASSLKL